MAIILAVVPSIRTITAVRVVDVGTANEAPRLHSLIVAPEASTTLLISNTSSYSSTGGPQCLPSINHNLEGNRGKPFVFEPANALLNHG